MTTALQMVRADPDADYTALGERIRLAEQQVKTAGYALGDAWWNLIARINAEYGKPVNAHVNAVPVEDMERIGELIGYRRVTIRSYRTLLSRVTLEELHALIDEAGSFSGAVFRIQGRSVSDTGSAARRRRAWEKAWIRDLRREEEVTQDEAREMISYYLGTTTWEHIAEVWGTREPDFPGR